VWQQVHHQHDWHLLFMTFFSRLMRHNHQGALQAMQVDRLYTILLCSRYRS